jgi:quinol monooxygenase YgiN
MLIAGELVTRDVYVQLTEKIFGSFPMRQDQSPDGLILHTAGESPHGFYIYDVWESQEHFGRFAEEKIAPAAHEVLGEGATLQPEFYEIEVLVEGR